MKDHTLNLPLDLTKRHFIIGDIHGRLEMLERLLDSADYDPATDMIYTVGDMIDRGPHSVEVLELFSDEPNWYSIRGNHEVMVTDDSWYSCWLSNGGVQTLQSLAANAYDENWLKAMIERLPYVIDVGEQGEEHSFRILHADLPPGWSEDMFQYVLDEAEGDDDPVFSHVLWSRRTIEAGLRNVKNLKLIDADIKFDPNRSGRNVFVGHTPIRNTMTMGDITFLDTWAKRTLSMVEAITKQVWSVPFKT